MGETVCPEFKTMLSEINKLSKQYRGEVRANDEISTRKGTESPGTCPFDKVHEPGIFQCVRCGTGLFRSSAKFESGTGWPSFYEPISPMNVATQPDLSLGTVRTEVLCARCHSHLGHVFDDGHLPTGKRYSMNGFGLTFVPESEL